MQTYLFDGFSKRPISYHNQSTDGIDLVIDMLRLGDQRAISLVGIRLDDQT